MHESFDDKDLVGPTKEMLRIARKVMIRTVEAVIDEDGRMRLLEPVHPGTARRALVTILDERPGTSESAFLSEAALAEDWNRPEDDQAWAHLQQVR